MCDGCRAYLAAKGKKFCQHCKRVKDFTQFQRSGDGEARRARCNACLYADHGPRRSRYMKDWRAANREQRNAYMRAYKARNPDAFPELIVEAPALDVIGDVRPPELTSELPRAHYQEDDWVAEVAILEDLSTREREAYHLVVVRTVEPSQIYRPVPEGSRFRCDQAREPANQIFTLTRL